ncbi:aryl-alcohol dehydrogenase-like predicted oxidoreductase [Friedmanniella endophytica]|uniref:Aryl-alcohol dehydrogenase-like predicted oxidoreductase n=1 Tax=Microlunatus kandeliicorticis TaxID=1759536 RepID=A0A7W3IV32_9ACTN|nr:aldo/keto reductase [Microlunatus kandeliicorticis]MBA8795787.1 aryl-alcohol dehydrogenase-like predicted oxidoreductase [Microlunatus kandeliicorticis]
MEYRQLGRSGLMVSTLTMGTMTFGGSGNFAAIGATDIDGGRRQIDMCLDAGVNLIDTANMYSRGVSEEIVGAAIRGRRDDVLLSTKVRFPMGEGPNDEGLSRHHILNQVEASLRRLGTDHIDIYHVHEWDGLTPMEETLQTLDTLVTSGKVRYLGISNYAAWQLMKMLALADAHGWQRFVSNQIYYTLEARDAEYELVPLSIDQGLGIMVWSPLAGGLLSGKYRRNQQASEGRHLGEWSEPPVRDQEKLYDTIELVVEIADGHGVSPAQVSLAYLLTKPGVTTLVIGARKDEQLADNLAAADLVLTTEEIDRLDEVSAPPLTYPHWHQLAAAQARFNTSDLALYGPRRPA